MRVPIFPNCLVCSAAGLAALVAPANHALAKEQPGVEDEDEIVVIALGSRRESHAAADTVAPVDVVSGAALQNQGDTDLQNVLRTLVPSYNVNTQVSTDGATLIRPANLRGLPPDSTLVFVNGKRRHRAAVLTFFGGAISDGAQGPDISVIPAIALKQLEVLRDGASSQYGSDAIAGALNFQLRDNDSGLELEAEYGATYAGDGDQYAISANLGLPLRIGTGGFVNLSAELGAVDATDRSAQRDEALALIAAGNAAVGSLDVNTVTEDVVQIWGQPDVRDDLAVFVNIGIPFSRAAELYAFGNYAERRADGSFFFRNPITRGGVFSNDDGATLLVGDLTADGSGNCPTVAVNGNVPDPVAFAQVREDPDCFVFNEVFPGGFTPRFGGQLRDQSLVAGLRGELGLGAGLLYDVSFTYGENDIEFFIDNTINASLGPDTPTSFDPGGYNQRDLNANVDFVYALPNSLLASDINLAFGGEFRQERFTIRAGDQASFALGPLAAPSTAFPNGQGFSSSSNGFGGFTPASAGKNSQYNYAAYLDVEFDITPNWTVQTALRYEDFYNSFGDTLNYKFGTLVRLSDTVSLRSTWSTGFKAPTAGQANVSNVSTTFARGILEDQGTIPLSSGAGQFIADRIEESTGVRPTLTAETSRNFSIGAAWATDRLRLTIDYFHIAIDDRIGISTQQDFFTALSDFAADIGVGFDQSVTSTSQAIFALDNAGLIDAQAFAGSEDLGSFGFFTNSFDTSTQGVDVVASLDLDLFQGARTQASLNVNWTDTTVTDRGLDGAAPLSLGRSQQIAEGLPALRGNLAVSHVDGPMRGLVRFNYFGEYFECHLDSISDAAGAQNGYCDLPIFAGSEITVDVEAALAINQRFDIIAGAQNLLDNLPDINPFAGVAGSLYPSTAPNGFSGGFYYLKLRAQF